MSSCRCSSSEVLRGHAPTCAQRIGQPVRLERWQEEKLAAIAECVCAGRRYGLHERGCGLREAEPFA